MYIGVSNSKSPLIRTQVLTFNFPRVSRARELPFLVAGIKMYDMYKRFFRGGDRKCSY